MESIFESLENLNISEECFNDIMDIVEAIISERNDRELLNRRKRRLKEFEGKNPNMSSEEIEKIDKSLIDAERKSNDRALRREGLGGRKLEKQMSANTERFGRDIKNMGLAQSSREKVLNQKAKEHPENIVKVARQADNKVADEPSLTKEVNGRRALKPSSAYINMMRGK
jgi:hypothetical protein